MRTYGLFSTDFSGFTDKHRWALSNDVLISDQRYRTYTDAEIPMPVWVSWLPEKIPMPD